MGGTSADHHVQVRVRNVPLYASSNAAWKGNKVGPVWMQGG
jgi:hypothetical protein